MTDFCNTCPRHCAVDRTHQAGFCGIASSTDQPNFIIARAALHMWEEPCISGSRGSGTVFFSGCNLRCIFCQNHEIAIASRGLPVTPGRLKEDILRLQDQGANNINLVTPSHYVPELVPVLADLRSDRPGGPLLHIPVVYNTGGYDSVETLRLLDGLVDVYLPDFKYTDSALAGRYSHAADYPQVAEAALREMFRQVGTPRYQHKIDEDCFASDYTCEEGIMTAGMIIRHLVLPGKLPESKDCLRHIHDTFGEDVPISIMNQYTPCNPDLPDELGRALTSEEYEEILTYAESIGIENGFIQEGETAKESFIPPFSEYEGV